MSRPLDSWPHLAAARISATEIVRSSVLTNKNCKLKRRNNGTNSMPATIKPQTLTLLRWRQRSCQGWSCRVTSPQKEVVCIEDYHLIYFVGFQVCPVGNVRSCLAPLDSTWCLVPWRSQRVHIHMPCKWTIMNPRIYAPSFRYYDFDFHIDGTKRNNKQQVNIHWTVAWPWRKRSTITKEAVQRFQASVRARMSG